MFYDGGHYPLFDTADGFGEPLILIWKWGKKH